MNAKLKASAFLIPLLSLIASLPALAHHGNAAYENKTLTLKGTVTAWLWTNPHVLLKLDVKDDGGNIVHWVGELVAPSNMINFGFTAGTLKAGRRDHYCHQRRGQERRAYRPPRSNRARQRPDHENRGEIRR